MLNEDGELITRSLYTDVTLSGVEAVLTAIEMEIARRHTLKMSKQSIEDLRSTAADIVGVKATLINLENKERVRRKAEGLTEAQIAKGEQP